MGEDEKKEPAFAETLVSAFIPGDRMGARAVKLSSLSPKERRALLIDVIHTSLTEPIEGLPDGTGVLDLLITREVMVEHETYVVPIVRDMLRKFSQSTRNKPDIVMNIAKKALDFATREMVVEAIVELGPEIKAAVQKQIREQWDAIVDGVAKEILAKALERVKDEMLKR